MGAQGLNQSWKAFFLSRGFSEREAQLICEHWHRYKQMNMSNAGEDELVMEARVLLLVLPAEVAA